MQDNFGSMETTVARVEQEKMLMTWKAPNRPYKERGKQFLTVPMVIAALVGIILLMAGEWILIAVITTLIFAYYAWTSVVPEEADYAISTRGIRVAGKLYEWEGLIRWWVTEKWEQKLLAVETPLVVVGKLVVPFKTEDEKRVVEIMERYLMHEKPEDTWMDRAEKWMLEKFPLTDKA